MYFALYGLASTRFVASRRFLLSFVYWLGLMCAGNVWGYVPIRAITTHADIPIAAAGFGISTWILFPFVAIPAAYIGWHFFCRMFPKAYRQVSGGMDGNLALLIAVTAFWFFSFYGADGLSGSYGLVSQSLSILSRYLLFPLCVVYLSSRYAASSNRDSVI